MELSNNLHERILARVEELGLKSPSALARHTRSNYMLWSRILKGETAFLNREGERAVCELLGVDVVGLAKIVANVADSEVERKTEAEAAIQLWRWVAGKLTRSQFIEELGYKGPLPEKGLVHEDAPVFPFGDALGPMVDAIEAEGDDTMIKKEVLNLMKSISRSHTLEKNEPDA